MNRYELLFGLRLNGGLRISEALGLKVRRGRTACQPAFSLLN